MRVEWCGEVDLNAAPVLLARWKTLTRPSSALTSVTWLTLCSSRARQKRGGDRDAADDSQPQGTHSKGGRQPLPDTAGRCSATRSTPSLRPLHLLQWG